MSTRSSSGHRTMKNDDDEHRNIHSEDQASDEHDDEEDDDDDKDGKKSRRELPTGAVATLKAWLLSPEHFTHPYPTPQDQATLMQKTGIDKKQLKNWFTNARRRIWKPMLKKQLEQGKIAQTTGGNVVLGGESGLIASANTVSALGASFDTNSLISNVVAGLPKGGAGNTNTPTTNKSTQAHVTGSAQAVVAQQTYPYNSYLSSQSTQQQQQQQKQQQTTLDLLAQSTSLGSFPLYSSTASVGGESSNGLNKSDSHAVLMELFVRDQDLVRQYTEGMKLRAAAAAAVAAATAAANNGNATQPSSQVQQLLSQSGVGIQGAITSQLHQMTQHPMATNVAVKGSGGIGTGNSKLSNGQSVNSWPHFSSVSSLNNLGSMTGVKSITNMSGADLAGLGSLNKKGNLAHVKSMESMGNADSYAFLEVFFDNPLIASTSSGRGVKREREEDDNIGLSLDGDESSPLASSFQANPTSSLSAVTLSCSAQASREGLRQAFEEARAARGLISVSRSCEKLSELPAKMQRSLSQEYIKSGSFSFTSSSFSHVKTSSQDDNEDSNFVAPLSDPSSTSASVEVPSTTKCALCGGMNVDTQLRPCGHMFHGRCLKPSLQKALGVPKCPCDGISMQSAVLAIPTDSEKIPLKVPSASLPAVKSETY